MLHQDRTGSWYTGVEPSGTSFQCQEKFDVEYTSGGATLTAQQVAAIAGLSKDAANRNFEVWVHPGRGGGEL